MKERELFEEQRPLIWDLVADLLDQGKKVLYHAYLPGSSSYFVGNVNRVLHNVIEMKRHGVSYLAPRQIYTVTADDDELLVLRKATTIIADYIIQDVE